MENTKKVTESQKEVVKSNKKIADPKHVQIARDLMKKHNNVKSPIMREMISQKIGFSDIARALSVTYGKFVRPQHVYNVSVQELKK